MNTTYYCKKVRRVLYHVFRAVWFSDYSILSFRLSCYSSSSRFPNIWQNDQSITKRKYRWQKHCLELTQLFKELRTWVKIELWFFFFHLYKTKLCVKGECLLDSCSTKAIHSQKHCRVPQFCISGGIQITEAL